MPAADAPLKILALSGSLRALSSNTALLRAAAALAPDDIRIELYDELGTLPSFSPDLEKELYLDPDTAGCYRPNPERAGLAGVRKLNERVKEADALLIACPEYARGVPGAFKNALDWLVGGDAFIDKPFALFNASPRATHAQESLRITLETMSGRFVEQASIVLPLLNRGLDAEAILSEETLVQPIREALLALVTAILRLQDRDDDKAGGFRMR